MKPDIVDSNTDEARLRTKIKFNTIDTRGKVGQRIAFRLDSQQQKFIIDFSEKYKFNESQVGRFAIDVLRVMEEGGLLKIFIDEYFKQKGGELTR